MKRKSKKELDRLYARFDGELNWGEIFDVELEDGLFQYKPSEVFKKVDPDTYEDHFRQWYNSLTPSEKKCIESRTKAETTVDFDLPINAGKDVCGNYDKEIKYKIRNPQPVKRTKTPLDEQDTLDELIDDYTGIISIQGEKYLASDVLKTMNPEHYNKGFRSWYNHIFGDSPKRKKRR